MPPPLPPAALSPAYQHFDAAREHQRNTSLPRRVRRCRQRATVLARIEIYARREPDISARAAEQSV